MPDRNLGKNWGASFHFEAIGVVQTPFKDKFGIPRQPGLASTAKGVIKLTPDPDLKTALRSLEEFSHLWIVFVFHEHGGRGWKPSVRPPRLGGNRKVGVLASRSPHRPNPVGLSAVILERIDLDAKGGPEIHVSGVDLLDGTPVLDIKPYIPYADSIPNANAGWASAPIERVPVELSPKGELQANEIELKIPGFRVLMLEVLELDPRPSAQKRQLGVEKAEASGCRFGVVVMGFDVQYEIRGGRFRVLEITVARPS